MIRRALTGVPTWAVVAIAVIVALAVAERVVMMLGYTPAMMSHSDAATYVILAHGPVFIPAPLRPGGYMALLKGLHGISGSIEFTLVFQHALGLATAGLAFLALRRLGAPLWAALVPAACYALLPDFLYFEHSFLSETLYTFLVVAAVYAVASFMAAGVPRRRALLWLAGAGVLLAAAATVRTVGVFLVPVVLLVVVLAAPNRRLIAAGVLLAGVFVGLAVYLGVQRTQVDYVGLTVRDRALYSRVAPFADCTKFTPPKGTEKLCETSYWGTRQGPDWYAWDPASPAWRAFGQPPNGNQEVGKFAKAALFGQPGQYIRAVLKDLVRYVDPDFGYDRPHSGEGPYEMDLNRRSAFAEALDRPAIASYYGARDPIHVRGSVHVLGDVQQALRIHGAFLLIFLLLAVAGAVLLRARERLVILLLAGMPLTIMVISVATTTYDARYAVPLLPLLVGAGLIAARGLIRKFRPPPVP